MNPNYFKDVLVPVTTVITLLSVAVSSLIGVLSYRLKLISERRLQESTKAEIDVKLLDLMINLIQKANGRSGYEISHDSIKQLLESQQVKNLTLLDINTIKLVNTLISEMAVVTLPVGSGEQIFAIRAIAELANQHIFLKSIGKASLTELSKIPVLSDICNELLTTL